MRRLGLIAALFAVLAQGLLGGVMPPARADRLVLGAICGAMGNDEPSDPPVHDALCRLCPTCSAPDGPGLLSAMAGVVGPIPVARVEPPARWARGVVVAPGTEGRPRAPPGAVFFPTGPLHLI